MAGSCVRGSTNLMNKNEEGPAFGLFDYNKA